MCGIAGYIGDRELDPATIQLCLSLMRRRGPDASAHYAWRNRAGRRVDLLHSRLSIIDLDPRASQPFHVGTKWLTYNGELYNYLEVREALVARGRRFVTSSDTEVLLAAIDELGWEALDRCEGMWAFGMYDEADGSLTLCRDRFGEKPLYIYRDGSGLFFGSEPKFLAALRARRFCPNVAQVHRYLVNGYKALYKDGQTFFHGLSELSPATRLHVDADGRETLHRYWQPRHCQEDMSYDAAVAGARDRLLRAVEIRLRADVPLAFCMSGGVDSTALIALAKNACDYDVHGFTIVNDDARYDERDEVARSVAALGIRHTTVPCGAGRFLDDLRTMVRHHDSPVSTITYFAHWRLMDRIAQAGYRVSISGTAADELFTGYYDHHLAYLHEIRDDAEEYSSAVASWIEHIRPLVRNPYLQKPDLFTRDAAFRDHIFLDAHRFAGYLTVEWREPFVERTFSESLLRNRMLNELFHEVVPVILHEDDLNAMYFSVENRSPYLDRALFEFCYRIPTRHLIRQAFTKAVLRDAVRGIAPAHVVNNRRKVGFNVPIFAFLDRQDPAVRRSVLADSPIFDHVRRAEVAALLDKAQLPNSDSKFLFNVLNAKLFLEEFAA